MVRAVWSAWIVFVERTIESRLHYWATLATDVVAATVFLTSGFFAAAVHPAMLSIMATLGYVTWGLLEYALHRWILHGPLTVARRGHMRHHANSTQLISTPIFVIVISATLIWLLLSVFLPRSIAAVFVGGMYVGYNCFAWIHHLQHHHAQFLSRFSYFRRLTRRHILHHNRASVNFGISTGVWDHVFRTCIPDDGQES